MCHFKEPGKMDDSIYPHDSTTGPIKSGWGKLMITTMKTEAWLVVISWNMEGQERLSKITQKGSDIEVIPERHKFYSTKN